MCKSILGRNSKLKPNNSPLFHIKTKQNAKTTAYFVNYTFPALIFFNVF